MQIEIYNIKWENIKTIDINHRQNKVNFTNKL